MGKIVCYNALTLKANTFGMVSCAAHNILLRIYFFFGTFGDAICQAGQTFLPSVLYAKLPILNANNESDFKKQQQAKKKNVMTLFRRLGTIAVTASVVNSILGLFVCRRFSSLFTNDVRIVSLIQQNGPWMAASLLAHPCALLFEGSMIAGRDVSFLAWAYFANLALLVGLLTNLTTCFAGVWQLFFAFQTLRTAQFVMRVGRELRHVSPFDHIDESVK